MDNEIQINLYPEMNKEIVDILRLADDNPVHLYAAQLIEEQAQKITALEQQEKEPCKYCGRSMPFMAQRRQHRIYKNKLVTWDYEGKDIIYGSQDKGCCINFCPMCGRKLEVQK